MARHSFALAAAIGLLGLSLSPSAREPARRAVTIDDLMGLRTIVDAKISPSGDQVAYVVSTPSVERNAHESVLFVIPAAGGTPRALAPGARIFTPTLPAPRLRWTPDGSAITFLALEGNRPQVFSTSPASSEPARAITSAPDGVFGYEWSPDGGTLAFLTPDPARPSSPATRVGALPPATRLWLQPQGDAPRPLTPADRFVQGFSWSPDGKEIAYASAAVTGFLSPYFTRIDAVPVTGRPSRSIVDRGGMNTSPQYSPDGRLLSFITTAGRTDLIAPRGLAVVPVSGGGASQIRAFPMNGAWIAEVVWARDSRSILVTMNEGTFATGAEMFEMPIVRVSLETGAAERAIPGERSVDYSMSVSRDGRLLAYRAVKGRDMGVVTIFDGATGKTRSLVDPDPQLDGLTLGKLEAISWPSFDGMEIWGLLVTPPGWAPGRRVPTIVYCHGGPIGGVTLGIFPQYISDLADLYYLSEGGDFMIEYFKRPWENAEGYAKHSPLTFADRVTTPLLMQHGERDPRAPLVTAQKFHRALVARGKTVELDIYPGGGHVMYQPVHERDQMQRNLDWFLRWMAP